MYTGKQCFCLDYIKVGVYCRPQRHVGLKRLKRDLSRSWEQQLPFACHWMANLGLRASVLLATVDPLGPHVLSGPRTVRGIRPPVLSQRGPEPHSRPGRSCLQLISPAEVAPLPRCCCCCSSYHLSRLSVARLGGSGSSGKRKKEKGGSSLALLTTAPGQYGW